MRVRTPAGADVPIRSRHERTLLAILLFRVGQPVTADQLVATLWSERPPASYLSNLHTYLSRLRSRLPDVAIEQVNGAYRIQVEPDDLDLLIFQQELAAGRAALAEDDPAAAIVRFRRGLALWRGEPLADLSIDPLDPQFAQLSAERLGAIEDCVDAELTLADSGDRSELLAELHGLVVEHPLRERLHGQLMVALCLAGRRANALAAYQSVRNVMITELGIEPGPELRRLHQAILRGEDVTFAIQSGRPAHRPQSVFPVCQLPPPVAGFVGRTEVVEQVVRLVTPRANAVPLLAISGPPGIGKSALVVRVAHQLRTSFPDGQIFAQLTGATARRDPSAVLTDLLHSLGVPAAAVPQSLPALTNAYRARLADRRVLVVLDDAADPAQVRALLPGTPGSAVLVTSRSRLSGLTDAAHLQLGPLTDDEAHQLLRQVAGPEQVAGEPGQAARIATACGNLPLALRIAGTRLATRMSSVATLADRLDDQHRRLTELAVSDQQVRASLALSVQALTGPTRKAFGLLHLLGPVSFAGWAVAALLGRPDADRVLDELVEASLLEPVHLDGGGTRYRLHDLLRVYSAELAGTVDADDTDDVGRANALDVGRTGMVGRANALDVGRTGKLGRNSDVGRTAALERLLATTVFLIGTAAARLPRTLTWSRPTKSPPDPPLSADTARQSTGAPLPAETTEQPAGDPLGWLDTERAYLVAVVATAETEGADRAVLQLTEQLAPYLWIGGHWADLRSVQRVTRRVAARTGNDRETARMDLVAGVLSLVAGDVTAADGSLAASRSAFEQLADRHGLACVLADQAVLRSNYQDGADEAVRMARRAIELFEAEGDPLAAILTAPGLSAALRKLGRLSEALVIDQAATGRAVQLDVAPVVVARCLNALALTRLLIGQLPEAYTTADRAVRLLRASGERYVLIPALHHLALAAAGLDRREEAVRLLAEGHGIAVELGDRIGATGLERDLAASRIGDGQVDEAVATLRRCLRTFRTMGSRSAQATTLAVLAHAYGTLGDPVSADTARQQATRLVAGRDSRALVLSSLVLRLAAAAQSGRLPVLVGDGRSETENVIPRD
ncbi:BTAD domain-containing putative transcriptional regulator [Micromonospora polyrhachis]